MFKFIFNVTSSIFASLWFIILTIITGKQSKISIYHFEKGRHNNTFFDVCEDEYIETHFVSNVSDKAKAEIIKDFINHLCMDDNFTKPLETTRFPIFDGREILGESNYYSVINDSVKTYLK